MSTPFLTGDATNGQLASGLNDILREQQNSQITQVFKDDTGTRRVLAGRGADGFYGFKVSKEGVDVYTATNEQLIFNSDSQSIFNIIDSDTVSTPTLSIADPGAAYSYNLATTTIAHGLSYTPTIFAYIDLGGSFLPLPYTTYLTGSGGASWYTYSVQTDATNVYISVEALTFDRAVSEPAYPLKYFLLQESAN